MIKGMFSRRSTPLEGRALFDAGALVLDVRTPEEFSTGHVEGALNVPVGALSDRLHDLGERDRPIVVYCRSGGRSATAASILRDAGFSQICDIGPMPAW
jgi:phage shock protein E